MTNEVSQTNVAAADRSEFYKGMRSYSQFESKAQFNEHTKALRYYYADQLNETTKTILDVLAKHAIIYIGVACPKIETIAGAVGKSRRTVQNGIKQLRKLGIITAVCNMRKKTGGNGANYYIFNAAAAQQKATKKDSCAPNCTPSLAPRQNVKMPTDAWDEGAENERKAITSIKLSKKLKDIEERNAYTREAAASELDYNFCRNDIPQDFITAVVIRDRSAAAINKAWTRIVLAFNKSELTTSHGVQFEDILNNADFYTELLKRTRSAVRADKLGEIKKDFYALLYGTAAQLFDDYRQELSTIEYRETMRKGNGRASIYYNWLEEDDDSCAR